MPKYFTAALEDEVLKAGGQPPIKLFIHVDGADCDLLLMKPSSDYNATPGGPGIQ